MSRTCDVVCAVDHVVRFIRPSPSVFAYCKRSKTTAGELLLRAELIHTSKMHPIFMRQQSACDISL